MVLYFIVAHVGRNELDFPEGKAWKIKFKQSYFDD
jgi:hypothetical protein